MFVNTEEECKLCMELVKAKVEERDYRDKHGGRRTNGVYASTAAIRARSVLSPDIVSYLDRAFTKRGMKENIVGRKKRNYPKRSAIIKIDPKTGAKIYPKNTANNPESLKDGEVVVKKEKDDDDANTNTTNLQLLPVSSGLERVNPPDIETFELNPGPSPKIMGTVVDSIITNDSSNIVGDQEQDDQENDKNSKLSGKISKALFKPRKQKRSFDAAPAGANNQKTKENDGDSQDEDIIFQTTVVPVGVETNIISSSTRITSVKDKDAAVNIVDQILETSENNKGNKDLDSANVLASSNKSTFTKHSLNTRMMNQDSKGTTMRKIFNPLECEEVNVRKSKVDKVKELLEKDRKKKAKHEERRLRKLQKERLKEIERKKYHGMGNSNKTTVPTVKFSKAQMIPGRRRFLKGSGEVVDVAINDVSNNMMDTSNVVNKTATEIISSTFGKSKSFRMNCDM